MRCPHAGDCPLFSQFELSSALKIWQIYYCDKKFEDCVRYEMNCRGEVVPPTLLPNGEKLDETGAA